MFRKSKGNESQSLAAMKLKLLYPCVMFIKTIFKVRLSTSEMLIGAWSSCDHISCKYLNAVIKTLISILSSILSQGRFIIQALIDLHFPVFLTQLHHCISRFL